MNLPFIWQASSDPHRRGYHYVRVNTIALGGVQQHGPAKFSVSSHLPEANKKLHMQTFKTLDEAKAAVEKATITWFKGVLYNVD